MPDKSLSMPAPSSLFKEERKRCIKTWSPSKIFRNIFLISGSVEFFKNSISKSAAASLKAPGAMVKSVSFPKKY